MTVRDLLDAFSGALLSDGRILSGPEQQLLANLLRRVKSDAGDQGAAETIRRAVGEIIAERAYAVLGESVTRRLIDQPLVETNFPPLRLDLCRPTRVLLGQERS
jgi:hypothetical protein